MRVSLAVLTGLASLAVGQNSITHCAPATDGVCFSVHVPSGEASTGPGDLHMQVVAPTSMPWVALGQSPTGMMMGANMFVVYQAQDGKNVTVSNRAGHGHMSPKPAHDANITVLESSGIKNGKMIANLRCSNCNQWQTTETMDLGDSKSTWIYAYGPETGKQIHNNTLSAAISIHEGYGVFKADLTAASGGSSSSDPFGSRALPTASSAGTKTVTYSNPEVKETQSKARLAHAVLGGLGFGLIFPVGSILMRLGVLGAKSTWKLHAGIQIFAYLMAFATLGTGVYLAKGLLLLDTAHAIVGLTAVSGIGIMPFLGLAQHYLFVRSGARTLFGHVHAYLGRAFIILGIINLPLGLRFAEPYQPTKVRMGKIAYSVLVGIIGVTWITTIIVTHFQRRKDQPKSSAMETSQLGRKDSGGSSSEGISRYGESRVDMEKGRVEMASDSDQSRPRPISRED